jgi:hemoglobin
MTIELNDRAAVKKLVTTFYAEIKKNELLSPIFNQHIMTDKMWEDHFEKLTDFWESILHEKNSFQGRPGAMHMMVQRQSGFTITQKHFDTWLTIWRANIRKNFHGKHVEGAITAAENLGNNFHKKMKMVKNQEQR